MQHHDPVSTPRGEEEEASGDLKSRLGVAVNVLAAVAVDLNSELLFASNFLAPAARRVLAPGGRGVRDEWPLTCPGLVLHAGVGTLDLPDSRGLARRRYISGHRGLAHQLHKLSRERAPGVAQATDAVPDDDKRPGFAAEPAGAAPAFGGPTAHPAGDA